ncbi:MAG: YcaQ family DNA glycosylase [Cryobacterium sp.]|nr:YcaQ family DNA glycosylase [Cryobacterium sp.]
MGTIELDPVTARRIAVAAQMLTADRPHDLVALVSRLTLLQIDPTAAIAPNADLVLWSRLGGAYRPADLVAALEHERTLFELDALIRPMADLPIFLAEMRPLPMHERTRDWLESNARFRRDILDRLRDSGPLPSRDIPDTSAVSWASTGWTNNRNTTQMLELLARLGEVAISHRVGRERYFDLAERVYPDVAPLAPPDARRLRNERRLAALGLARAKAPEHPLEPTHVEEVGVEATVRGVRGTWRIDTAALELASTEKIFAGRTALLSPFDRLSYDRVRALELFDFEYTLEMYKPAEKRRWGYFALPVLHHDRLVGKVDAKADRKAGILTVTAIHQDVPFDAEMMHAVNTELDGLAEWLGLARR